MNLPQMMEPELDLKTIFQLDWHEFELLIQEAYKKQGYSVVEGGWKGPNPGPDLLMTKDGRKTIVQCKQWTEYNVRLQQIRQALSVMVAMRADECIYITSGKFTKDAKQFAEGKPIQLIEAKQLIELLKDIKISDLESPVARQEESAPACPECGSLMIRKRAGRGHRRGKYFWGCSQYPVCLCTRS